MTAGTESFAVTGGHVLLAIKETATPDLIRTTDEAMSTKHPAGASSERARGRHRRANALVASDPATPEAVLVEVAKKHPWTHSLIAANHGAPPTLLTVLAMRGDAHVRQAVACNPSTPSKALALLTDDVVAEVVDTAVRHHAARSCDRYQEVARWTTAEQLATSLDPQADPAALDVLSYWPRKVRVDVARNPATSPATLRRLADDARLSVRREVAMHPSAPPEGLERLADDDDRYVRREVATRRDVPPDLLTLLGGDRHAVVRDAVAGNPHSPDDVIARLAVDADADVRRRVAARKKLRPALLHRLAEDDDPRVRTTVAKHPRCPAQVLAALREDPDPRVRETATARSAVLLTAGKVLRG